MLWLILIAVGVVLMFVLFAKPTVNTAGVGIANVPLDLPRPQQASQPAAPVAPAPPAEVSSVNFNDVFAPKAPPSDRPNA